MLELLTASENQVFSIALLIMLIIAVMEGVATLLGMGVSSALDTLLPDIDIDVDSELDVNGGSSLFTQFLGWMHVGKVPILMLLVVFLTVFGLLGIIIQSLSQEVFGSYLPGWLAVVPVLIISLPFVRITAGMLHVIMPKDETEAVAEASFVGCDAEITLGIAKAGSPAQAKLIDEFGQSHYVMVEPEASDEFSQGTVVRLTEKRGSVFSCVPATDATEV